MHRPLEVAEALGPAGVVQRRLAGLFVLAGVPVRLAVAVVPVGVAGWRWNRLAGSDRAASGLPQSVRPETPPLAVGCAFAHR